MRDRIRMGRARAAGPAAATAAAALSCAPAMAQSCGTYTVAPATTTFVAGTTDIGLHQDDGTQAVTLPFAVSVYGQSFNSVTVSSNGNLQFQTASTAFTNACLPTTTFNGITLMPYWDDLYTVDTASGQGVFTALSGTPGSQQFVIEFRTQFCCATGAPVNDFEVIFYENQNFFDFVYGSPLTPTTGATVGVQFSGTGPSTQIVCNAAGPTSGQSYRFTCAAITPGACCAPAGTCSLVLQTACASPSTFNGGTSCSPNPCPQPAGNDVCQTATVVGLNSRTVGSNATATNENPAPPTCNGFSTVNLGVWLTYTEGPTAHRLSASTCDASTTYNTRVFVYSGSCSSLVCVNANATASPACAARSDAATVTFCSQPNTQYFFLVTNDTTGTGTYAFHLDSVGDCNPPANDTCAGAEVITSVPFAGTANADTATDDVDVGCNSATATATRFGVWYRYTTGADGGRLTLGETGANDVVIGVFTGANCGSLTEVACFDAEANDFVDAAANTTYWFLVGMWSPTTVPTAPYQFTLNFAATSGSCCVGTNCTLTTQSQCTGTFGGANTSCGGPTAYRIVPSTSTYEDITATGTVQTALRCDDCGASVPLPFTFNYLGTDYTSVWVTSNGFIQFGAGGSTAFTNAPIPTPGAPDNFVAALWDDFDISAANRGSGDVYVLSEATRVVISWVAVGQYNLGNPTTDQNSFQVVIRADGEIEFRYGSITPENTAPSAGVGDYTVGYEDATGANGSSVPGASLGSGNTALRLTHASPCTGGGGNGACCAGTTCSVSAQGACSGANTRFVGPNTACNAAGNNTQPCCRADYNQSGAVTVQDIFDFLAGYFTQSPQADINGAGGVTVQDIFDFLAAYFTGC